MTTTTRRARDYGFCVRIRAIALHEPDPTARMLALLSTSMLRVMRERDCTFEDCIAAIDDALPGIAGEHTPAETPGALAVERERKAKVSWLRSVFGRLWR